MPSFLVQLLQTLVPLLIVTNPVGLVPLFLVMTEADGDRQRQRTLRTAALTMTAVLLVTAVAGHALFAFFGVSLAAFQIAGGILLFAYGFEMLQVRLPRMKSTQEEIAAGVSATEIGITPLGIPMLAGPGAIATVLVLRGQLGGDARGLGLLVLAALLLGVLAWAILALGVRLRQRLTPTIMGVIGRLQGLLLVTIAVQMALAGIGSFDWGA